MNRKLFAAAFAALTACGPDVIQQASPSSTSSPLIYLEGEGIEACGPSPIARGLAMHFTPGVLDEARSTLVASPAEVAITDAEAHPVPLEQVSERFRARFVRSGTYTVTATFPDGARVSRELTVVEAAGLRLGESGRQLTTHDGSGDCVQPVAEGPLPALAPNQELRAWIIAVDAAGRPLLGELELEFSGTASAHKWLPGSPVNSFLLEPKQPGTNVLTITETGLRLEHQLSFEAATAAAACPAL